MTLKTLNELQEKSMWISIANIEIIKQEAIKWVKAKVEYHKEDNSWTVKRGLSLEDWMKFFNITEEDLK